MRKHQSLSYILLKDLFQTDSGVRSPLVMEPGVILILGNALVDNPDRNQSSRAISDRRQQQRRMRSIESIYRIEVVNRRRRSL